ncbi:MAG: permease [Deltaproteobacteria bacterium]
MNIDSLWGYLPNFMHSKIFVDAVEFFIYDTIKIFILMATIIFTISIIRSFLPPEKVRAILVRKGKYTSNVIASLIGIITPFCSCSAIPLFLGFVQAGVPLGATFSFLVASPMINEVAIVLLIGIFGWKIALMYVVSGLVIAIVSGILIGKMKVENLLDDVALTGVGSVMEHDFSLTWKDRFEYAYSYTTDIIKKVWLYIVVGVGAGAIVHGYVPADFLAQYAGADKWYGVLVATAIGVPLYASCAGVIPLVGVLTEKGVALGTTLAFMMAVTGLSLPEFLILKRVMKVKLIIIFASIVACGIIFTGYLFNFILG